MRKILLFGLVILTGICFTGRLFYLQIYTANAFDIDNDNAIRKVFHYPKRGYIYDRNDKMKCKLLLLAKRINCMGEFKA